MFTDNVPANNNIWIVGDNLLREASGHFEKLRKDLKSEKGNSSEDNRIYLDKNYAIKIVSPGMYTGNNIPLVILDSVVDTMNEIPKLPHTVIMVVNDRKFWNDKFLLKKHMETILSKFMKEFHKITDLRKYALDDKAVEWDQPRVFITRPLPLPNNLPKESYPAGFRSNRRKYNRILDRVRKQGKFSIINLNGFTSQNKGNLFTESGSISEKGFQQFWIELSNAVQLDDDNVRIIARKIKAKQISSSIQAELMIADESDSDSDNAKQLESPKSKVASKREVKIKTSRKSLNFQSESPSPRKTKNHKQEKSHSPSHTDKRNRDNQFYHRNQPPHHPPMHQPPFPGFFRPQRRYTDYNGFYQRYPKFHGPRYFQY